MARGVAEWRLAVGGAWYYGGRGFASRVRWRLATGLEMLLLHGGDLAMLRGMRCERED